MADPSADLRALTGAPTRVVWVQDAGAESAVGIERPTLKLVGFDTEDGKGERVILGELARYWRPQIMDDGTRVMFGDLGKNTVNIVNWDGSGRRTVLENAKFEDVWTDPVNGTEWFYVSVDEQRAGKDVTVIRRHRLDDPSISELVWDKSPLYNFMINGDGRTASGGISEGGNTPQGIFSLPNGSFNARAGGCWPSMSPDNSLRSWVFTGNHRSIHFAVTTDRSGKGYTYGVEFNKSPGLTVSGREELYHPRWSNDVRFITATAPLSEWSYRADVKLPRETADKVEIYLGKFADDMQSLERWVKVSENDRGDYYPSAWIKQPPGLPAWLADSPQLAEATASVEPDSSGQVFLWETSSSANQLIDKKTGAINQSVGLLTGEARYDRGYVMDLTGGAFIPDDTAGPWLASVKTGGAFAVEAVLTPFVSDAKDAVVLAFGDNIVLSQQGDWLTLKLKGQGAASIKLVQLPVGQASHVIVSYAPGRLGLYVNGQLVLLPAPPAVSLSGWTSQPLVFGDAHNGGHDWSGLLEGIGLFGREMGQAEAKQRTKLFAGRTADRPVQLERAVVDAKLIGTCPPADPQGIAPYKRCLSVQQYQIIKVIDGKVTDKIISVAQWSVLDGRVVPAYLKFKKGETYRLTLETWSDHPEQESERMINGDFEEEGELYYEMRHRSAQVSAPIAGDVPQPPVWETAPGQANLQWLAGPVLIKDEANPEVFNAGASGQRDTAGQNVMLEASTMPEILVTGSLHLGGNGAVKAGRVISGGQGFVVAPDLELVGGEGQGATAMAGMGVSALDLVRLGTGYTDAPEVVIAPPDIFGGRQATAVANIDKVSGALSRLRVTDSGSGYLRSPAVSLTGGGGGDASVEALLSLTDIHVLQGGRGYSAAPEIVIKGGGGSGAEAAALMQLTTIRFTGDQGDALIHNTGTVDQDGGGLVFDWAAKANNTGKRGINNEGLWVMRNGALAQYDSSTGRPFWSTTITNSGTLRMLDGSQLGLQSMDNSGTLQLASGAVLSQFEYARGDLTISNRGIVQVFGDGSEKPVEFGQIDPERNGKRTIQNGDPKDGTKARFTVGDGKDSPVFLMIGGGSYFINHPGAVTVINAGASLALLTNDNGSRNLFASRESKLTNNGDLLLSGSLRVQGNHAGFMGIENTGRLFIRGDVAGVERLPNSAGPGSLYKPELNPARIVNLAGGGVQGEGIFTYKNSTENDGARFLQLVNLGGISPGADRPGKLAFVNVNIEFGAVPAADDVKKKGLSLDGAGLLRIMIVSANDYGSIELSSAGDSGVFTLADGAANTLNIVSTGSTSPRGTFRIVTAKSVKGTFANLQFNGKSPAPYKVNYLADGIEVVFQ